MCRTSNITYLKVISYVHIDDLAITRDGNQLKKVTDYCDELTNAGAMDFKDGVNEHVEYTWDANGNMTCDLNKGLTEIQYNVLNLPEKITHSDGHITYITYAADGRKLRVTYKIDPTATIEPGEPFLPHGSISPLGQQIMANGLDGGDTQRPIDDPVAMDVIMTRDYCGAYSYRNGTIERIMMGNGFMQDSTYCVQIKDYQGNVRAVLDQNHNLVERNEYYPYGGLINASDTQLQPHKYSSKELDRENGLDWYDNQARWYDPILPQTTTQDPLAEKYYSISPYTWCAGNPVRFVDPSGKWIEGLNGKKVIMNKNYQLKNASSRFKQDAKQMRKTAEGRKILYNMINCPYMISINYDEKSMPKQDEKYIVGITDIMINKKDKKITSVKITIYEKNISNHAVNSEQYRNLTIDEISGSNMVHEGKHATDKKAMNFFNPNAEQNAEESEEKHRKELIKQKTQKNNQ